MDAARSGVASLTLSLSSLEKGTSPAILRTDGLSLLLKLSGTQKVAQPLSPRTTLDPRGRTEPRKHASLTARVPRVTDPTPVKDQKVG